MSPDRSPDGTDGWRYRPGFLSDTGRMRERNEDAFDLYVPEPGVERVGLAEAFFAVADGMGGHEAGDVASDHAIRVLRSAFLETPEAVDGVEAWLDAVFHRIHDELRDAGRDGGGGRGMGSTLTVAVVDGESLTVGHVGDSRLYRLREGCLQQLTEDHSWVAEQARQGLLTEDEVEQHADRNVLTQCLGIGPELDVFFLRDEVRHGDRYAISSDGLHGEVDRESIERALIEEGLPQDAARRLVGLANAAGSPDNVTVVVFDTLRRNLAETTSEPIAGQAKQRTPKVGSGAARWLIGGGVFALLVGLALGARAFVRPGDDPAASSSPVAADTAAALSPDPMRSPDPSTPLSIETDTLENPRPVVETEPVPATPPSADEASSSSEGEDTP